MEISKIFCIVSSLYDQMPQGVILFDQNGFIKYINPSACSILNFNSKNLKNSKISDFTHPNDIETEQRLIETVFEGDAPSAPTIIRKMPTKGTSLSTSVLVSKIDEIGLDLPLGLMILEDVSKQVNGEPEINYLPMFFNHFKELVLLMEIKNGEYIVKDINNSLIREITLPDLNVSTEDLIGIKLEKLLRDILGFDESLITDSINRYDQVLQSGKPMKYTREYKIHDRAIYMDAQIIPIFERKKCKYFLWIGQNITNEKLSQQKLEKSEEMFRRVVQDQTDMIVRWIPGGIRTFVNEAYCKTFNLSKEEVIGTSFFNLISEKDLPKVKDRFSKLTPENSISSEINEVELGDGTLGWQEWIDRAFFDTNGKVLEYQSVGRDITEKTRAQIQLKQSQDRFANTFYLSPDAIGVTRLSDDKIIDVNKGFEKVFGLKRNEAIGKTAIELNLATHRNIRDDFLAKLLKDKVVRGFEVTYNRPDGTVGYGLLSGNLTSIDEEKCFLWLFRDITTIKETQIASQENEQRLSRVFHGSTDIMVLWNVINENGEI
ncbi:MAG: PAS domain S-box protein [Bacteroidetes bacterium]|nr:PAS domain S-box protein [Bacteroidota bacterium]